MLRAEGGSLPFETFMQEALYNPHLGYYTRAIDDIGYRGDFSTAATLGSVLGEAVARWLLARRRSVRRHGRWHVIEIGGGTGALAAAVLDGVSWWHARSLHYHLVEVSPVLRQRQQTLLRGRRVIWHDTIQEALERSKGRALIFSNELVDAFPCVVLRRIAGERGQLVWEQLELREEDQQLVEHWTTRLDPRLRRTSCSVLTAPDASPPPAADVGTEQRVEVHLSYRDWLADWLPHFRAGHLLTVDYGDRAHRLYARRPLGSLRAYSQHLRLTPPDVYRRFTRQDLTADVNFTDVRNWGEELGLVTVDLVRQDEFLARRLRGFKHRRRQDSRLSFISEPAGMGGAYRVLWQEKIPE